MREPVYRIFAFDLASIRGGGLMRIDDFEDHVTTLQQAKAAFDDIRKRQSAPTGARLILMQELDSFEVANIGDE